MIDTFFLAKSFVTLLVITDPVGTVPTFLAITADWSARQRNQAAWQAVAVATLVIATFALFGQQILIYLGISVPSLQIAGGLLLLVVALDLLRGELASLTGRPGPTSRSCRWARRCWPGPARSRPPGSPSGTGVQVGAGWAAPCGRRRPALRAAHPGAGRERARHGLRWRCHGTGGHPGALGPRLGSSPEIPWR